MYLKVVGVCAETTQVWQLYNYRPLVLLKEHEIQFLKQVWDEW